MKKTIAILMSLVVLVCTMAGCGAKGALNADYFAIYDEEGGWNFGGETLMPADVTEMLKAGMRLEITLDVESTGDYTFFAECYDPNVTDETADNYFYYHVGFMGTYTKEDNTITLGEAEIGDISYSAGSIYTSDPAYSAFSYAGDGSTGTWYSDDEPEMLEMIHSGIVNIDGDSLVSWTIE